jgi:hypothetical protein
MLNFRKKNCLKLRCDERFTHAFTACGCVFKEITLVGSNQGNYFENATACSKRNARRKRLSQLSFRAYRHFDAQYCDKKIILSHRFLLAKVSS